MAATIFAVFALLLIIRMPVSFSLAISSAIALIFAGSMNPLIVVQRMYTSVESFSLIAIPFFILSGGFMESGGISRRLISFSSSLVGHIKGGLAMVSIVAAMFFAGISGSTAAGTAAVGSVLIPAMEKKGYGKDLATSVVATAGSIGIIIPPSIPMIILGITGGISIGGLFLGGVFPGILMGCALMVASSIFAKKRNLPAEPRATWKERWHTFTDSILALMTMVIIMGGILSGVFTATEASVVAAFYSFFVGKFVYRELKWSDIPGIFVKTGITTGVVVLCIATASGFGWILAAEQIPGKIAKAMFALSENRLVLLFLMNILTLFMGTFLDISPIIIILVPILFPIASQLGVTPIHFGIMTIVNMAIGQCSPPVGVSLFVATGIAKAKLGEILGAYMKYLLTMIVVLAIIIVFPKIITFLPELVMGLK
jgi:C4-dicarboxylate transporter DctM subunit